MDKTDFVATAPRYYAVAIVAYLNNSIASSTTQDVLARYYSYAEENDPDYVSYFSRGQIFKIALELLQPIGIVEIIEDPFGPTIIARSNDFYEAYKKLAQNAEFPLYKYEQLSRGEINDGRGWLRQALMQLDRAYTSMKIATEDFDNPEAEWEPLPIERDEPELEASISAVDETIERVRSDNGYAANLPEERQYVLDGLAALARRLKEAPTISVRYLRKYGFEPLGVLIRRFKDAAIGIAATAAKEAFKDWLRRKGITFLDDLF